MEPLAIIVLAFAAVVVGNVITAVICRFVSRTRHVSDSLRIISGLLLILDIPLLVLAFVIMLPSRDEIFGAHPGFRGVQIAVFFVVLVPAVFLWRSAFGR